MERAVAPTPDPSQEGKLLPRFKDVSDLLAYFSQPLPGVLLTHLSAGVAVSNFPRKLWRKHRNGLPAVLLSEPPKVVTYQDDEILKQMGAGWEICPPATCRKE